VARLNCVEPSRLDYTDYVVEAKRLNDKLRQEDKCEVVIALTHSRVPNDERLARECPFLDLVLGGHDHDSYRNMVGQVPVIKSGTDFRELTRVVLTTPAVASARCQVEWEPLYVNSDVVEDPEAAKLVTEYSRELAKTMDQVIGTIGTPLDFKFSHIRTRETNGSNFVADCMRTCLPDIDVALLNSGTLRADDVLERGEIKMRHLNTLLPMLDELCVVGITGEEMLLALENGVSQWPKLEGRFPALSGVTFTFDGNKPPGSRIDVSTVRVGGKPLVRTGHTYSMIIKNYLRSGKDGYGVFKDVKILRDSDATPMLPVLMREAFHKHHEQMMTALAAEGANREEVVRKHSIQAFVEARIRNVAEAGETLRAEAGDVVTYSSALPAEDDAPAQEDVDEPAPATPPRSEHEVVTR